MNPPRMGYFLNVLDQLSLVGKSTLHDYLSAHWTDSLVGRWVSFVVAIGNTRVRASLVKHTNQSPERPQASNPFELTPDAWLV